MAFPAICKYTSAHCYTRKKQASLFYHDLEKAGVSIKYRKFPPIREFDNFGKLNYTEVLRHRSNINYLVNCLTNLLPSGFDIEHLRESLFSGVNSRLIGEVTEETYSYRHSIFSFSAGVEEVANIILTIIKSADLENKTLGKKLDEVRNIFSQNPKYFVNTEILEHITRLITSVRNDIAHPSSENSYSKDIIAIQSRLSSQLAFAFLQFITKTLSSFLDKKFQLVNVQILETPTDKNQTIFYFGFDGDFRGDYLEMAFEKSNEDEVRERSHIVHEVIGELKKLIYKATKVYFLQKEIIFYLKHLIR
ncbi:hypothetical protein D5R40_00510 [Okeania hirsuta]|uniref:Minimal CRISPR polymerase domain-containing protein n=1 Tax=Okeania hirsuta TaxID=1458930 RepID=A0A3N6PLR1_9CYAN|nr:hypothetical protein [Okeania hirsuta]RQH57494.1 hypothetical protein D5R40_00510 [Okeania hirsuta]